MLAWKLTDNPSGITPAQAKIQISRLLSQTRLVSYLETDLRKKLKAVCNTARSDCKGCIGLPESGQDTVRGLLFRLR
jgi:hypothetical protein